jgi:hypothetical protein
MTRRQRSAAFVLAAVLFASYAYFYEAGGWNQNSRFALDRAILERSTLRIDAYALHTGDRALWHGHYYSDKAPGASLTALAPVAVAREISRLAGVDPEGFPGLAWTSYVATVATSAVFTTIAALLVFGLSLRWGASTGGATFAALAYGLSTPAWAYAALFMGHAQTAGCLMLAFAAADGGFWPDASPGRPGTPQRQAWLLGLSGSWAVVTEFPAAIPAIFIGLFALGRWRAERRRMLPLVGRVAAGVAIAALPLFVYNTLAFGSPLHIGYASEEGFGALHTGFYGITYPKLHVLWELLFGAYRGLLPLAPVVALAPIGLVLLGRSRRTAGAALVAGLTGLFYLLLNASYFYWEGGWAYGPRQTMAAMPFVCLGLAPLWTRWRRNGRALLGATCLWGVALTLVAVATTPQPPASFTSPMTQLMWPAFRDGDLSLNYQTFVHGSASAALLRGHQMPHAAWNLGEIAGLHGLPSLLPLMVIWAAAAGGLWMIVRDA